VGKYRDEAVAVKIIRTQVALVPELLKGFYKEVKSSSFSARPLTSSAQGHAELQQSIPVSAYVPWRLR